MNVDSKIEEMVIGRNWGFANLLKLTDLAEDLAVELYDSILSTNEIIDLIWEENLNDEIVGSFGELYRKITLKVLSEKIMKSFQIHFENATVNFNNPVVKESPKNSDKKQDKVSVPKPKTITEKNVDGTDLPEGVKRV